MSRPLAITGSGMVSSVGLSAEASCAAIRCAIDNFQETRFMDQGGEWMLGSSVELEEPWRGTTKLSKMLSLALQDLMTEFPGKNIETIPILICVAEKNRPGRLADLEEKIFEQTQQELGVQFHPDSALIPNGGIGVSSALLHARQVFDEQHYSHIIIAGVDSLLVGPTLAAFEEKERLLTSQNSNGFIPGEAASAVMIQPMNPSEEPQLCCLGIGRGIEKATEDSELPLRADGLVQAVKSAMLEAQCDIQSLDFRITDSSGSQYSFKEAALLIGRYLRYKKAEFDIWHPADCIGEVGSALGPSMLAVCLAATRKDYAPGNNMLMHIANESEKRAAMMLSYQTVGAT